MEKMLLLMIIAHVIGDYSFQTKNLVELKKQSREWLSVHGIIYSLAMGIVFLCSPWPYALSVWVVVSLTHLGIDAIRVEIEKKLVSSRKKLVLFCIDQCLHIVIILSCWFWILRDVPTFFFSKLSSQSWFKIALAYSATICIIWDPPAVLIRFVLEGFSDGKKPNKKTEDIVIGGNAKESNDDSLARAGEMIGKFERLIIVILFLSGATTAIGFVLTAKSLARFPEFEKRNFAERYLIGTLFSVSIALLSSFLLSKLIQ